MFNKLHKTLQAGIALIFVFVLGWGTVSPAHAATIRYVKWDAGGANNGKSWANAYTDLQTALTGAPSGTEIWVAAGTYTPASGDNRGASFVLRNGVSIYGGFAGTETQRSQRRVGANETILSGDIGALDDPSDNSYHVVLARSVNTSAVLNGFTITKGNADGGTFPFSGGGILVKFGSTPTLETLTITENTASVGGGGLASYDESGPRLTRIIFRGNSAAGGGGMYSPDGSPILNDVIFEDNHANTGGGLFTESDSSVLTNVTFSNNIADLDGGGMANHNGSPNLTNVTFSGNTATRNGGGMFVDYFAEPVLTNVTFTGNSADGRGGALALTNNSKPSIVNSIFWDDSASERPEISAASDSKPVVSKSVIQGGCPASTTCKNIVTKDPLLDSLGDYGGFTQTVAILEDSSAIDTGDDANCPSTDQRGLKRPQGSHCDIGAFESGNPGVPVLVSPANDAIVGSFQPTLIWNPSNPDVISYDLQVSTNGTFKAIVIDETDILTSWFKPFDLLEPSVRYYWRVRAVNIDGDISGWSSVRSFRTPLEAPTLVSPDPGESFTTDRVTFIWNPVDVANRYALQVSTTANFSGLVLSTLVDGTEYTTSRDLPQNKTLYWRVRGVTSLVVGLWSTPRTFTSGNPPSIPVLVAPVKGALVRDFTPKLNWNDSILPAGSTFKQYEVQVDDNKDFSSPIDGVTTLNDLTDSDFTPAADLDSNTRYYWRVRAVNIFNAQDHTSAWSQVWSFITVIAAPTSMTVVPTGNPLQPGFDWDDATGQGVIKNYTIQISTNSKFTTFLVNATRSISEYSLFKNLPAGKTIYWRVRVNGANGPSAWSTDSFTTP